MPVPPSDFDAERFAALWAGFDMGNASEAEAMNKGRALRRMVAASGLRIVDVMGRADVMQALDAQLQPVREESAELKAAFLEIAKLADLAKQREEMIDELREELAEAIGSGGASAGQTGPLPPGVSDGGLVDGGLVAAVSIAAVALMIAAAFQAFQ